jgi:hypothetical protein
MFLPTGEREFVASDVSPPGLRTLLATINRHCCRSRCARASTLSPILIHAWLYAYAMLLYLLYSTGSTYRANPLLQILIPSLSAADCCRVQERNRPPSEGPAARNERIAQAGELTCICPTVRGTGRRIVLAKKEETVLCLCVSLQMISS